MTEVIGAALPPAPQSGKRKNRDDDDRTLFVYHIVPTIDSAGIRELFKAYGTLERAEVKFKPPPQEHESKGFGFVTYSTRAEAEAAKAAMHGAQVATRLLRVSFVGEKAEEPTRQTNTRVVPHPETAGLKRQRATGPGGQAMEQAWGAYSSLMPGWDPSGMGGFPDSAGGNLRPADFQSGMGGFPESGGVPCAVCGSQNPPNNRFCGQCGSPMQQMMGGQLPGLGGPGLLNSAALFGLDGGGGLPSAPGLDSQQMGWGNANPASMMQHQPQHQLQHQPQGYQQQGIGILNGQGQGASTFKFDNPANWPQEASNELFVFYLPQSIKDNELRTMYATFGELKRAQVAWKKDGSEEHKGFGFVTFVHTQDAVNARAATHGTMMDHGKNLRVTFQDPNKRKASM